MIRRARWALVAIATTILILVALYVWPTPWRYEFTRIDGDTYAIRVNRFTDRAEFLTSAGWESTRANRPP